MPAKRRIKVKKTKRLRRIKQQQSNYWLKFVALALLGIILVVGLFLLFTGQKHVVKYKPVANISSGANLYSPRPKFTPLISPYPKVIITITPTPAPLTGFCLHVPILTYHHIQPEAVAKELGQTSLTVDSGMFDQQMAYLVSNGYTPILANELITALLGHSQRSEEHTSE